MGITPYQYLMSKRLEQAAALLSSPQSSIAAIGLLVFVLGYVFAPGQFESMEVSRSDGSVASVVDPQSFHFSILN